MGRERGGGARSVCSDVLSTNELENTWCLVGVAPDTKICMHSFIEVLVRVLEVTQMLVQQAALGQIH